MKRKQIGKLALHRETLRILADQSIARVLGGEENTTDEARWRSWASCRAASCGCTTGCERDSLNICVA